MSRPRRQCRKCPWRTRTDPHDIPDGYSEQQHRALSSTIARPGDLRPCGLRIMACHETPSGKELPCVGWSRRNQLGPGNNLGAATRGDDRENRRRRPDRR